MSFYNGANKIELYRAIFIIIAVISGLKESDAGKLSKYFLNETFCDT